MNSKNNKLLNAVAILAAIAIVATSSAVFVVYNKKKGDSNVVEGSSAVFQTSGNPNLVDFDSPIETITDENGETQYVENVTDKNGVAVTDKDGHNVQKPATRPNSPNSTHGQTGSNTSTTTQKFTATTPITDSNASQAAGAFGFTWDPNSGVFYSTQDPWQRQFGYNQYYDKFGSYVALWYDTVRVKFNYGGYDWLVQFWKGQYGFLLLGAEAGVYYKDENDPSSHYVCTDNSKMLKIGYTCYNKDAVLFERSYQDTWWLTGFVPGRLDKFADRSQLKMKIRITLKDAEMTKAFVEALEGVGFTTGNASTAETYYTSGNDVYLMWQTDKSKLA